MKRYILPLIFLFAACGKSSSTAGPDTPPDNTKPPKITDAWPNNNPVGWPVLIKGSNIEKVTAIYFGDKKAVIDTLTDSVATTYVPDGIAAGPTQLTLENAKGKSNTFTFTVLAAPPEGDWYARKPIHYGRPKYLPSLPDQAVDHVGWRNPYRPNYFIVFDQSGNHLDLDDNSYPFQILEYPRDSTYPIAIDIKISDDSSMVYRGNFIAKEQGSTAQRILFYDESHRQIVVVSN